MGIRAWPVLLAGSNCDIAGPSNYCNDTLMTSDNGTIDLSKSPAELTGIDWGPPPPKVGTLIRERHEIRRTPLRDVSDAAIVRFLEMNSDMEILVPVALERLRNNSDAIGLLCALLRSTDFKWREQPGLVAQMRDRVENVISEIGQITDDMERISHQAGVWMFYALFERHLSAV